MHPKLEHGNGSIRSAPEIAPIERDRVMIHDLNASVDMMTDVIPR